jgi:serine protease AprX
LKLSRRGCFLCAQRTEFIVADIIAFPLAQRIRNDATALQRVILTLQTNRPFGEARSRVSELIKHAMEDNADHTEQYIISSGVDPQPYVTARLQGQVIERLVQLDQQALSDSDRVIVEVRTDLSVDRNFDPDNLLRTVISVPMLNAIEADEECLQSVMIEINSYYAGGRDAAKRRVNELAGKAIEQVGNQDEAQFINVWKSNTSEQYVYAKLIGTTIRKLVELDQQPHDGNDDGKEWNAIYHVWPDFRLRAQIWRSVSTVKADACRRSFATTGKGIVWAVFDSGIDGSHPHFHKHANLVLPSGLAHMDFTGPQANEILRKDLTDDYGHGTHVAGIIAGELDTDLHQPVSLRREKDQNGKINYKADLVRYPVIGVAPECTLLSYKVLDKRGEGDVSTVIAAIQKIQDLNGYGRHIAIHGVNMSLGYDFDPEWFACGQSPICVEVDRLVRSGVAVVIAAGNTGKGFALTINDPGNSELALTVGATHRDMPHRYGVSYFSSKGPTGDGRSKPDLLAPGERIVSCGAGPDLQTYLSKAGVIPPCQKSYAFYLERSGTSMATPHVSGIIAGILSTRAEFVGLPEQIKDYLVNNATDLNRERNFQGGGLVDMMRAIQAM